MKRIRLILPNGDWQTYRHLDIFHDALVTAFERAGVPARQVVGHRAAPWNFAVMGFHRGQEGFAHSLVVSTPDPELALALGRIDPSWIQYTRAETGERICFKGATLLEEDDPIAPGQTRLGVLLISPLLLRNRQTGGWHRDLQEVDLSTAISHRLSRLAGRPICLQVYPDSLYLRAHPDHSVLVSLKGGRHGHIFAIGMQAPLLLCGPEEDLRFAWYAGIGEKTRMGFGCLGLLDGGLGR